MKAFILKHYTAIFITFTCIMLLFKNLMLQGYIAGSNHFTLNLILGAKNIGWGFILEMAVFGFFVSFAFLFKGKGKYIYLLCLELLVTTLCIIDSCYTRFFQGAPSVYWLALPSSTANVSTLKLSLYFSWFDILYLTDLPILIFLLVKGIKKGYFLTGRRLRSFFSSACIAMAALVIPVMFPSARQNVYASTNSTDQIANFTVLGYHVIDLFEVMEIDDEVIIDESAQAEIDEFYNFKNEGLADEEHAGIFKDKNLIYVQIESLETFVLGNSIDGQEITPNLNKYLKNSIYFDNLCEQVKNGNSSDCDLMQLAGMLPVTKGISFTHYEDTDYHSLPELMEDNGYYTLYCHGDNSETWNYKGVMGRSIGFNETNFEIPGDELVVGYKADSLTLAEAYNRISYASEAYEKFMGYVILASSHLPFEIPDEYKELVLPDNIEDMVQAYLHAVHYVDACIGDFMDKLEADGILENTSVVFLGDHGGIHKYAAHRIDPLEEDYPWMGNSSNYRVPYFIYNKDIEPETVSVLGGQIDVFPTTAYLYGVSEESYMNNVMGRILLKTNRNYAFLSNGNYVGDLTDDEYDILSKSFYLSDLMIRGKYFGTQED